jgi:hypothetical protein
MSDIINEQTEDEILGADIGRVAGGSGIRGEVGSLHGICLVHSSGMPWLVQMRGSVLVAT